jgi:ADP-heptose:LPS heptosyltransferase
MIRGDKAQIAGLALAETGRHNIPLAETGRQNILIVKLGAFGNIILSLAAYAAIRQHHATAWISVLTSPAYADWLRTFPYFDQVLIDPRPAWWDLGTARQLGRMLTNGRFSPVFPPFSTQATAGVVRHRPRLLAPGS